jgi:hypothetical protein
MRRDSHMFRTKCEKGGRKTIDRIRVESELKERIEVHGCVAIVKEFVFM